MLVATSGPKIVGSAVSLLGDRVPVISQLSDIENKAEDTLGGLQSIVQDIKQVDDLGDVVDLVDQGLDVAESAAGMIGLVIGQRNSPALDVIQQVRELRDEIYGVV